MVSNLHLFMFVFKCLLKEAAFMCTNGVSFSWVYESYMCIMYFRFSKFTKIQSVTFEGCFSFTLWYETNLISWHCVILMWKSEKVVLSVLSIFLVAGMSQCFWIAAPGLQDKNELIRPPDKDRNSWWWMDFQWNTRTGIQRVCSLHPWIFSELGCAKP